MIWNLLFKYRRLIREIILYGIIGGFSATIDSIIFYWLSQSINIYVSNFISINTGILISFLLNTYVNFKAKDKIRFRAVSFFSVGYTGLGLSMLILYIGVEVLNYREMFVKILSVFIVAAVQFTLNKMITFRRVDSLA